MFHHLLFLVFAYAAEAAETPDGTCEVGMCLAATDDSSLIQNPAVLKRIKQDSRISRIFYVNLERSTERRSFMDVQLAGLDVPYERFSVASFVTTARQHDEPDANFTDQDVSLLRTAFGAWKCGDWQCPSSEAPACCWGFDNATKLFRHANSAGTKFTVSRGTSWLGNLASHILLFRRIMAELGRGSTGLVVLTEDDVIFLPHWKDQLQDVLRASPDWDVVRLFNVKGHASLDGCKSWCPAGQKYCLVESTGMTRTQPCTFWSAGALLVKPERAGKIIDSLEQVIKSLTWRVLNGESVGASDRYSIDHLLNEASATGLLKLMAMRPPLVLRNTKLDNNSTFSE